MDSSAGSVKKQIVRFNCGKCKRFLLKFIFPNQMDMTFLHCINCKHTNIIKVNQTGIDYVCFSKEELVDPEGEISQEEINKIEQKMQKLTLI